MTIEEVCDRLKDIDKSLYRIRDDIQRLRNDVDTIIFLFLLEVMVLSLYVWGG